MRIAFFLWMSGSISLRSFADSRQSSVFSRFYHGQSKCAGVHSTRFLGGSTALRLFAAYPQTEVLFYAACRLYIGFKQATAKLKSPIRKRSEIAHHL